MEVVVTYESENYEQDWVAIYDGTVTPTADNYSDSISNRLSGPIKSTKRFIVPGNTVRFFFKSDSSNSNHFGYFATVTSFIFSDTANVYEEPTLPGYEFVGWYTDADCTDGNEFNLNNVINEDSVTVYAKYAAITETPSESLNISNDESNESEPSEQLNGSESLDNQDCETIEIAPEEIVLSSDSFSSEAVIEDITNTSELSSEEVNETDIALTDDHIIVPPDETDTSEPSIIDFSENDNILINQFNNSDPPSEPISTSEPVTTD